MNVSKKKKNAIAAERGDHSVNPNLVPVSVGLTLICILVRVNLFRWFREAIIATHRFVCLEEWDQHQS